MASSPAPSPRSTDRDDPAIVALVLRAQAGELPAFNQLVLRYQDHAYSLALRMLGAQEPAEDATQEAFVRAWQRLDSFRGGSFRAWLFTIVANQARDELRRRGRRPQTSLDAARDDPDRADLDPADSDPLPDSVVEQTELRDALHRALMELPEDWRQIVLLSDVHGLDYQEIADSTGLALGTVKSRLSRARARLREIIRNSRELAPAIERLDHRR